MSRALLFAGPSLWPAPPMPPGVELRPPAAAGDILRALAERGVSAIGLADGVFESAKAVQHKEILAALEAGIPVLGGASMGALRAAELAAFGMAGVGRVFEAYRDGRLTADADVAVVHAPAELGFRPLTVALADIRLALDDALAERVVDVDQAELVLAVAAGMFFKDRTVARIMSGARNAQLAPDAIVRLAARWYAEPPRQKQRDAIMLLEQLRLGQARGWPAPVARFALARTPAFERLAAAVEHPAAADPVPVADTIRPAGQPAAGQFAAWPRPPGQRTADD